MKRIISILSLVLLYATLFSGCQSADVDSAATTAPWSQETEAPDAFDSVEQMKEAVDGIWMNCKTGDYIIIGDGKLVELDDNFRNSELKQLVRNVKSFDDFYKKIPQECGMEIEYDPKSGSVILLQAGSVYFEIYDEDSAFDDNSIMFVKEDDVDYVKDGLLDHYIEAIYPNLLTNKDVQFDKYGSLGQNFTISGVAALDDYYNWGYSGLEAAFFCISIRPTGGSYSDEWYIYASRENFKELFDSLKDGSKDMRIIAQLQFADTGSNNMATLVDYFD
ncbi:MAG: hypothetical protein E7434_03935 [Ruminococcaceae bacterium]|nr:hypothetical protein [Oscillospiraceae bacterium]